MTNYDMPETLGPVVTLSYQSTESVLGTPSHFSRLVTTTRDEIEEDQIVDDRLAAVSRDQWLELWDVADAIAALDKVGEWGGGDVIDHTDDGHDVYEFPFIIYAEPVNRYEQLFYEMDLVVPYERVLNAGRGTDELDWLDSASIADVVRFNSSILRGERFGEGCIENAINAGAIAAIVGRLKEWRESQLRDGGNGSSEFATWMRSYRDDCRWQAAKAGPPHEYTVRDWRPEADEEFVRAAAGIREFGYEQSFYGNTYTYFDLDGLKYWTMGEPLAETTVLNRDPVENRYPGPLRTQ